MITIKRLNIFIDESGDFGFVKGSSDLYAVSFTLHESSNSIKIQLNMALAREISKFINDNREYINSFDKIVIYYDNGQETLATILDTLFANNSNVERRIEFDHTKKRLFQVSDMLTVIDKLDYKRKNNIPFTKAETFFFRGKDFRHIINLLKNKRI